MKFKFAAMVFNTIAANTSSRLSGFLSAETRRHSSQRCDETPSRRCESVISQRRSSSLRYFIIAAVLIAATRSDRNRCN